MISVEAALARLFALLGPLPEETVPLRRAAGRVLARAVAAGRDQPPFDGSAMDGYALADADPAPGAVYRVIGEAAAGARYGGAVGPGEAVRIFTGAPVPEGALRVVIQEDVTRDGDAITLGDRLDAGRHIRPRGADFAAGWQLMPGRRLGPADLALLAAMNIPQVPVVRAPEMAILCTGDELVLPGDTPGPDQIIAANGFGLAAMAEAVGARVRMLPIARDSVAALTQGFDLCAGADLIVTVGGASVGDHDLVARVAIDRGATLDFHKVAMRPGKPLMAGRLDGMPLLGLPGNPVSAMVCGTIFMCPALRVLGGEAPAAAPRRQAALAGPVAPNGPRAHYMRAALSPEGTIAPLPEQDSSLLRVLAEADGLLLRPPGDGARQAGEMVEYIPL